MNSNLPEIESLATRVAALASHELSTLLNDQLVIVHRIDTDPPGLFEPGSMQAQWHEELTSWERSHVRTCLGNWLDVIEQNVRFDANAPTILNVREFGATGDGVTDDRTAIENAIAAAARLGAGATVFFPAGRYRLTRPTGKPYHLRLHDLRDIVLQGQPGTELLASEPTTLIRFDDCLNIRVRSLALDYDPLLHIQGTIVDIAPDRSSLTWEIADDYPSPADWGLGGTVPHHGRDIRLGDAFYNLMALDENQRYTRHETTIGRIEHEHGRTWRIFPRHAGRLGDEIKVGCTLLLNRQTYWTHGTTISGCQWIDFDGVEIWGSTQFALYIESSTGVSVRNSFVRPKADGKRLGGIVRDGIHCRSNRYGPFLQHCTILRAADDCTNFQTKMVSVDACLDDRTVVLDLPWDEADRLGYWNPRRMDFSPGDLLTFLNPSNGGLAGWARVESVAPHDWHGHRRLLAKLDRAVPGLIGRQDCGRTSPVRSSMEFLDLTTPQPIEHFAMNSSTKSDGFVIRDCTMGENSVTAGKIKGANGLICNNRTFNHGWCVWSMATEFLWQEGFAARRILIEGNHHDNWFGVYMGSQGLWKQQHIGTPLNFRVDFIINTFEGITVGQFAFDLNSVVGVTINQTTLTSMRHICVGATARHVLIHENCLT